LSADQKRAAAERLVDQALIRREMEVGGYDQPKPAEADAMLANLRRERFPSEADYENALNTYGVTEQQLKQHLLWQLASLRFTDVRFGTTTGPVEEAANTRERSSDGSEPAVDQQMENWLKEARSSTKIRFKQEAFQ
jgi:nucleoside-diphosphate-sugar epimerase